MPRSVNRVILLGHIGRDAETTQTSGGVTVSNFSLATARSVKTKGGGYKDQTDWHNVVVWQSEKLAPYLTKGRTVLIEGRLHSSTWESNGKRQIRVEVIAENVVLLDKNRNGQGISSSGDNELGVSEADVVF